MKRSYDSTGRAGTAKKTRVVPQMRDRYDVRTGQWTSAPQTGVAAKAAMIRNVVSEKKGMDTLIDIAAGSVPSTTNANDGSFVLNLIQQGSGSWNRVGRKTHLKSVRISGFVRYFSTPAATTAALVENVVRMVVVWDKQPSGGAVPTFDSIFGVTAQDGTESCPDISCPPRYDNMDRFRVLRDKSYQCTQGVIAAGGTTNEYRALQRIDEYIKLPGLESVYSGQSSPMTIADISSGALYVYFRAYGNQTGSQAVIDGVARVRYTD
jgi:hypothetical protein